MHDSDKPTNVACEVRTRATLVVNNEQLALRIRNAQLTQSEVTDLAYLLNLYGHDAATCDFNVRVDRHQVKDLTISQVPQGGTTYHNRAMRRYARKLEAHDNRRKPKR
jgi:hypothetical protein